MKFNVHSWRESKQTQTKCEDPVKIICSYLSYYICHKEIHEQTSYRVLIITLQLKLVGIAIFWSSNNVV